MVSKPYTARVRVTTSVLAGDTLRAYCHGSYGFGLTRVVQLYSVAAPAVGQVEVLVSGLLVPGVNS
jgi:hypothetical protein